VSPPRVTPAKLSEGSVSPPGVTTAKARVGDSATAVAGAPSGRAVSAGKPMVGWPVSRQRFTLADTRRKAPSWKKVLAILGVLAIVAVVLLVLFVRGW
jgi:cobalamin biosynthesis Mg chelatase CobN